MTLSTAVMAISMRPSIRLVNCVAESGARENFTLTPFLANRPFSSATNSGQLELPPKPMTLSSVGVAANAGSIGTSAIKMLLNRRRIIVSVTKLFRVIDVSVVGIFFTSASVLGLLHILRVHVAEQRALLERVVERHVRMRERIEPAFWQIRARRVTKRHAPHAHGIRAHVQA